MSIQSIIHDTPVAYHVALIRTSKARNGEPGSILIYGEEYNYLTDTLYNELMMIIYNVYKLLTYLGILTK